LQFIIGTVGDLDGLEVGLLDGENVVGVVGECEGERVTTAATMAVGETEGSEVRGGEGGNDGGANGDAEGASDGLLDGLVVSGCRSRESTNSMTHSNNSNSS
jgi:hypothetical protein